MRRTYNLLNTIRAAGAIVIVLYHLSMWVRTLQSYTYLWGLFNTDLGAVDMFFVLSGFILTLRYHTRIGKAHQLIRYGARRLIRIFPVYWIICILIIILYLIWKPPMADRIRYDSAFFWGNFFLFGGKERLIGPVWFLNFELYFYALFAVIFLLKDRRFIAVFFGAYALLILYCNFLLPHAPVSSPPQAMIYNIIRDYVLNTNVLEFIMGMLGGFIILSQKSLRCSFMMVLGVVLLFLGEGCMRLNRLPFHTNLRFVLYGIPYFFILLGAVFFENKKAVHINRLTLLISHASYTVYLLHTIVLQTFLIKAERVMRVYGNEATYFFSTTLILFLTVILCLLFYLAVEKKITRSLLNALHSLAPV